MSATAAFLQIDLPAGLAALFACLACGVLGNFLVLRKQSLMGDAISHAVLPGLVAGFLVTGLRATVPMLAGAIAAALVATLLIHLVRRLARLEAGAAMGVVFSILFALGLVMLEQSHARDVDLDVDCVLSGQLETILWLEASGWRSLLDPAALAGLPRQLVALAGMNLATGLFVALFWRVLKLTSFDPEFATALGFRAGAFELVLMLLIAAACVTAFEAVGSILVIAMLICPAATARLLTDRYGPQVALSGTIAAATGAGGYALAALAPFWLGTEGALNGAGMIAVLAGLLFLLALLFGPRHGVIGRRRRRSRAALEAPAVGAVPVGAPVPVPGPLSS